MGRWEGKPQIHLPEEEIQGTLKANEKFLGSKVAAEFPDLQLRSVPFGYGFQSPLFFDHSSALREWGRLSG